MLARRGHEIHLFGIKSWDGDDTITRDGLILYGVGNKENLNSGRRRSILQSLRYTRHLMLALRQFSGDLLESRYRILTEDHLQS